ncbi:hypothetical protein Mapa_004691 [Marchantia paleacea]|nr:hypothetical protein Mapa_004691 [Marchantia paleacea]
MPRDIWVWPGFMIPGSHRSRSTTSRKKHKIRCEPNGQCLGSCLEGRDFLLASDHVYAYFTSQFMSATGRSKSETS